MGELLCALLLIPFFTQIILGTAVSHIHDLGKSRTFLKKEPQESPAVEAIPADWLRTGVQILLRPGQRADDCLLGGLFVAHCVYAVLGLIGGVPLCPACSAGAGVWKGNFL